MKIVLRKEEHISQTGEMTSQVYYILKCRSPCGYQHKVRIEKDEKHFVPSDTFSNTS